METQPRIFVAAIEAGISAGKSETLRRLGRRRNVIVMEENIDHAEPSAWLTMFTDRTIRAAQFQQYMLERQISTYERGVLAGIDMAKETGEDVIVVLERTALCGEIVFMPTNTSTARERALHRRHTARWRWHPDCIVFLDVPDDVVARRFRARAREAESGTLPSYVTDINRAYRASFDSTLWTERSARRFTPTGPKPGATTARVHITHEMDRDTVATRVFEHLEHIAKTRGTPVSEKTLETFTFSEATHDDHIAAKSAGTESDAESKTTDSASDTTSDSSFADACEPGKMPERLRSEAATTHST